MAEQSCSACGGTGITTKVDYGFERDADGKEVQTRHEYQSQCSSCGGTGKIA